MLVFRRRTARQRNNDSDLEARIASALIEALRNDDFKACDHLVRSLALCFAGPPDAKVRRYAVPVPFLVDTYHALLEDVEHDFREVFFHIAGIKVHDTFVWTQMMPVSFAQQTASKVIVDRTSNIETMMDLDQMGLVTVGHVHSHPGFGAAATHHSATDASFIERLARGQSIALGAIFARSSQRDDRAYVRFYADPTLPFEVTVVGNDAEEVEDNVFQIKVAEPVANQNLPIPPAPWDSWSGDI